MNLWTIVVVVLLILGVFLFGSYINHRRTQAVKAIADASDFQFIGNDHAQVPAYVWHLDLFSKGRSRQVQNLVIAEQGAIPCYVFDYCYRLASGQRAQTHQQTVVVVEDRRLNLPRFLLIPETTFHRLSGCLGYPAIDFSAHADFATRYLLRGEDADRIRYLFNDGVISFYLGHLGVNTETAGNLFLYYYLNRACPPQQWLRLLQDAKTAQKLFQSQGEAMGLGRE